MEVVWEDLSKYNKLSLAALNTGRSSTIVCARTKTKLKPIFPSKSNLPTILFLLLVLVVNLVSGSTIPPLVPFQSNTRLPLFGFRRNYVKINRESLNGSFPNTKMTNHITSFVTKRAARQSTSSFAGTESAYGPEEHAAEHDATDNDSTAQQSAQAQAHEATTAAVSYDNNADARTVPASTKQMKTKDTAAITSAATPPVSVATNKNTSHHRDSVYIWSSLVAGIGSGALSSVMCAPLDLVRTRFQVWSDLNMPSATLRQAFVDIYQKEGWRGYFRGLGASLVTVPAFWGCYFPLYDDCKRRWSHNYPETNPSLVHCGSAVAAGAVSDLICNPMFVVRTRLQTEALHHLADHGTRQQGSSGMARTIRALYHEGGVPIFWRGMTANLMGLSHVAVQFPVYEWLKTSLVKKRIALQQRQSSTGSLEQQRQQKQHLEPNAMDLFMASGLSKMTASLLTYPHEVVRSRMMDARGATGASLWATGSRVYAQDGILGFYSGLPVALIRVIPNCCITFMTYELLLRLAKDEIRKRREEN